MIETERLKPGQVVLISKGRDEGKYAVVIQGDEDERMVWVADGDKRKFDKPKKKNILHLVPMPYFSPEVIESLENTGRVSNGKLRYALQKFISYYEDNQREDAE